MRSVSLICVSVLLCSAVVSLTACESVSFYRQSVVGQLSIIKKRQLIDKVLADPSLDDQTRASLEVVQDARAFATFQLGLPENGSFAHYVDTGKRHVVWNVFAAQALSVEPQRWCFPVAGCVAYRGYFNEDDAEQFATGLREDGLDVLVGGVNAYSTLGWFRDPVLNTVVRYPAERLAALIFHELTHEKLYVKDDTQFNESLATAIEIEGLKLWLKDRGEVKLIARDQQTRIRRTQFTTLLLDAREKLEELYESDQNDAAKRRGKQAAFVRLKDDYELLKNNEWGGYSGYDGWFDRDLNNAHLVPVASYHGLLGGFQTLLAGYINATASKPGQGRFEQFFDAVRKIAKLPLEERHELLMQMDRTGTIPDAHRPAS